WGGKSSFERMDFKEVIPEVKLVWHHSMADAKFNIITNPMMENWPRVLLTTVIFEDSGDQTKVTLQWVPHEATIAELETFKAAMEGLNKGWGSGMDLLATLLEELQNS
ncbi:MAG: SRPBCC domain-containing protein, partial [Pseudoruegeria sp.]